MAARRPARTRATCGCVWLAAAAYLCGAYDSVADAAAEYSVTPANLSAAIRRMTGAPRRAFDPPTGATMSLLPVSIIAAVTAINTASTREEVRAILDDWRETHWSRWVAQERAAHAEDAARAIANGQEYLTEHDDSWRVDYLPRAIHLAESRALARIPAAPPGHMPEVYYRARHLARA